MCLVSKPQCGRSPSRMNVEYYALLAFVISQIKSFMLTDKNDCIDVSEHNTWDLFLFYVYNLIYKHN